MEARKASNDLSHRDAARRHAVVQAWRRFGIALGEPDLAAVEATIRAGKATWVVDQIRTDGAGTIRGGVRAAYEVALRKRIVVAIFDVGLDAVVTLLPSREWIGREEPEKRARRLRRKGRAG